MSGNHLTTYHDNPTGHANAGFQQSAWQVRCCAGIPALHTLEPQAMLIWGIGRFQDLSEETWVSCHLPLQSTGSRKTPAHPHILRALASSQGEAEQGRNVQEGRHVCT